MIQFFTERYFRRDYSTGFYKDMLIFKKQGNIDSPKISYRLTWPFQLSSSKSNVVYYWVEFYVNCYAYFDYFLLLTSFLRYWNFVFPINKQVMLSVALGSELFCNRSDQTVRKGSGSWIWIQLPFNENRMKISIKKSNFSLPWNYLKLCENQLLSLKN